MPSEAVTEGTRPPIEPFAPGEPTSCAVEAPKPADDAPRSESPGPRFSSKPPERPADPDRNESLLPGPPRSFAESCALALACALVGSIPSALRAARAGGPFLGSWLGSAAIVLPLIVLFIALTRAAGRGYRMVTGNSAGRSTATGIALWVGLSTPAMLVLGAILKATTHHRGLGGATFGVLAVILVIGAAVVARHLVRTARKMADRGVNPTAIAVGFALLTIVPLLAVAFPLVRGADDSDASRAVASALVDGAIFVVATALAGSVDLRDKLRERARSFGLVAALVVMVAGGGWVVGSQGLALALRSGGGLAATILRGLESWTDRDHDGYGAYFGGGDCDEGDPTRHPQAFDIPGDGIDQDCDGHDASPPSSTATGAAPSGTDVPAPQGLPSRPSVVLITLDTVRADHVGAYGYAKKTTPALDALAARSTLFAHAYATGTDTQHALAPLVSGHAFEATPRDGREWPTISGAVDTLAERLQGAGYQTAAVTSFTWLSRERGFDQGFASFEAIYQEEHPERGVTGPHAIRAARAALAKAATDPRPLFLWVHLFDAHESYLPHTGFDFGHGPEALYDGEVAFVDRELGELVSEIEHSPRGATTAIIVHGSNGEAFGEHGNKGHGKTLFDEELRVPLVVSVPGGVPGRYEAGAVSTLDLAPTVLDLAGVAAQGVDGASLVPLLARTAAATGEARSEFAFAAIPKRRAVVEWPLKLVTERHGSGKKPPSAQLYDLAADPTEEHDLAQSRADDVTRLRAELEKADAASEGVSAGKRRSAR